MRGNSESPAPSSEGSKYVLGKLLSPTEEAWNSVSQKRVSGIDTGGGKTSTANTEVGPGEEGGPF